MKPNQTGVNTHHLFRCRSSGMCVFNQIHVFICSAYVLVLLDIKSIVYSIHGKYAHTLSTYKSYNVSPPSYKLVYKPIN